jgi:hypothetical protein
MKENIRGLGILVFIVTICYVSAITKLPDLMMEESHTDDCIVNIPILKNAKLAKPFCNWNMGFIKSGDKYYKSLEIKLVVVNLIYSLTTVHIT